MPSTNSCRLQLTALVLMQIACWLINRCRSDSRVHYVGYSTEMKEKKRKIDSAYPLLDFFEGKIKSSLLSEVQCWL
jgi:hypothetical protein